MVSNESQFQCRIRQWHLWYPSSYFVLSGLACGQSLFQWKALQPYQYWCSPMKLLAATPEIICNASKQMSKVDYDHHSAILGHSMRSAYSPECWDQWNLGLAIPYTCSCPGVDFRSDIWPQYTFQHCSIIPDWIHHMLPQYKWMRSLAHAEMPALFCPMVKPNWKCDNDKPLRDRFNL